MDSISNVLKGRKIEKNVGKRPINEKYEQAKQLSEYINIPVFVVMRLQKQYGSAKVAKLKTFLKDYPNLDPKRAIGMCHWFLKNH